MKRPRMDGPPGMGPPPGAGFGGPHGPPHGMGGPPMPYGGGGMGGPPGMMEGQFMGDQGGYGMGAGGGMGGMGGAGFPCVKLRGLPFDVSDDDIRMFLGVEPIDTVLVKRDGRLTGEAFVVLAGPMHVDLALAKNRSYMGRRYIEIYRARKPDYYRAIVSEVTDGGPGPFGGRGHGGGGGHYGGDMGGGDGGYGGGGMAAAPRPMPGADGQSLGTTILKLRGLPFSVSDEDICQWFNEDTSLGLTPVVKDNVLIVMEGGRPSGIAFVEFPTAQEATLAMAKNRQMMGTRYIEIFPANRSDLDRCR